MAIAIQLFSVLTVALAIFTINIVHSAPVDTDIPDEFDFQAHLLDKAAHHNHDQADLSKRNLDMEGILIGKREYPTEGVLLGKRDYPVEGVLLGKRDYPVEGVLLGKRDYPVEGVLLGKREYPVEGIMLGKREYPVEGIMLGRRASRLLAAKSFPVSHLQNKA